MFALSRFTNERNSLPNLNFHNDLLKRFILSLTDMEIQTPEDAYETVWQSTSHNSLPLFTVWAEQSDTTIYDIILLAGKLEQNGQRFSLTAANVIPVVESIPDWVLRVPGGSCALFAIKVTELAPPGSKRQFWDNGTHRIATVGNTIIDSSARGSASWNGSVAEFGDFRYEKGVDDGKLVIRSSTARKGKTINKTFREILPAGDWQEAARVSLNQIATEDNLTILFRYSKSRNEREDRLGFWGKVVWNLSEKTLEWSAPRIGQRGFYSHKLMFGGGTQEDSVRFSELLERFLGEKMPNGVKRLKQFDAQIGETHELLWVGAISVWGNPIQV